MYQSQTRNARHYIAQINPDHSSLAWQLPSWITFPAVTWFLLCVIGMEALWRIKPQRIIIIWVVSVQTMLTVGRKMHVVQHFYWPRRLPASVYYFKWQYFSDVLLSYMITCHELCHHFMSFYLVFATVLLCPVRFRQRWYGFILL